MEDNKYCIVVTKADRGFFVQFIQLSKRKE